jgi:hypothetical protein
MASLWVLQSLGSKPASIEALVGGSAFMAYCSALFGIPAALVLGFPALLALRALDKLRWTPVLVIGAVTCTAVVLVILFPISAREPPQILGWTAFGASLGAICGAVALNVLKMVSRARSNNRMERTREP